MHASTHTHARTWVHHRVWKRVGREARVPADPCRLPGTPCHCTAHAPTHHPRAPTTYPTHTSSLPHPTNPPLPDPLHASDQQQPPTSPPAPPPCERSATESEATRSPNLRATSGTRQRESPRPTHACDQRRHRRYLSHHHSSNLHAIALSCTLHVMRCHVGKCTCDASKKADGHL